jgi:hypothetical protein
MSTVKTCGYVNCICRDCFEIAVCGRPIGEKHRAEHHLCGECAEAGCDATGQSECAWQELLDDASLTCPSCEREVPTLVQLVGRTVCPACSGLEVRHD